jgi:glycosyltransferase involved in cell wall biosynthesis
MRVLHVVPTYLPAVRYGGPIYAVHTLCRALANRGHDIHVYTTSVDGPGTSNVSLTDAVSIDGVTVRYFPCGLGRRHYRSPKMGQALATNVTEFDALHLHSVFLWPTLAAARAAQRANVPYVLAPHGMLVGDLIARKSRLAKTTWIRLFERANIAGAAAVHVMSELEKTEFARLGIPARRVVVIPIGIELPKLTRVSSNYAVAGSTYVLSLGRINWKKGLDRLVQAMTYVPDTKLVIAGNDEENYRPHLETMARELGVAERVHFVGAVHGDEKWDLIRGAAIFALPSYSENFGIAALEAMACGCPVVVTPEVGLAGVIGAAGAGIAVDGEPKQLGAAIAALLADPVRRRLMGKAGIKLAAQDFSWARIAEKMEEIYRQLQGEREATAMMKRH